MRMCKRGPVAFTATTPLLLAPKQAEICLLITGCRKWRLLSNFLFRVLISLLVGILAGRPFDTGVIALSSSVRMDKHLLFTLIFRVDSYTLQTRDRSKTTNKEHVMKSCTEGQKF